MADIFISEYDRALSDTTGAVTQIRIEPRLNGGVVSNPTSSATYTVQDSSTKYLLITSSAAYHYKVATSGSPTATTSDQYMTAGRDFIAVRDNYVIAFINA